MKDSGLDDIAASWLGNGKNTSISGEAIRNEMVDKASPDGSLLENTIDNTGSLEGLPGFARKFFS